MPVVLAQTIESRRQVVWHNILMRGSLGRLLIALLSAGAAYGGDFRFAIVGDRAGGPNPRVYEQVWRELCDARPAFAINVGDTIQGGNDESAEAEWRAAGHAWRHCAIPRYFTPGNHDIWSDASRRVYERMTGHPPFYSFDHQCAHFTVLDNSPDTELSPQQMEFLERDLKEHRTRSPKFVFFHKPFWLVFLKLGSGEFPLHKLARKYGVDAVVSGHGHQLAAMERDGVRYLEVGSSGAQMHGDVSAGDGFAQGLFYQHVIVTVEGTELKFVVREAGPPYGRGRMIPVAFAGAGASPDSSRLCIPSGAANPGRSRLSRRLDPLESGSAGRIARPRTQTIMLTLSDALHWRERIRGTR